MALSALEERISKIKQQNEEIKRRHEEVEQDKKNAAKLNALVQMVPSTDWPERKEPPEYSNPPKVTHKQKSGKEQSEHHSNEKRKGEGPPPDPKYNFLADSERDEDNIQSTKDNSGNRSHNKLSRGSFKKRGMGRGETTQKGKMYYAPHKEEYRPDYEAWRKERNRIDEDRISRQKTAEGNWRREWDNDKAYVMNEGSRDGRVTLDDYTKSNDRRYQDGHNRGNHHRSYRGSSRNYHGNHDYHHTNSYDQHIHDASGTDERTVIATDKSLKVTVNQNNMTKGPVMSVKVNSPSIAGTGRVGPRQRTRFTYSSHSDVESNAYENSNFLRQKSFEDRPKGNYSNNSQKNSNLRRTQSQRKPTKDTPAKSPFMQRKEFRKEGGNMSTKYYENGSHQNYSRKDYKESQKQYYSGKSARISHKATKISKNNSTNKSTESTQENEEINTADNSIVLKSEEETILTTVKSNETSATIEAQLKENNLENDKADEPSNDSEKLDTNADVPLNDPEKIDEEIKTANSDQNSELNHDTEIIKNENINQEAAETNYVLEICEKNDKSSDMTQKSNEHKINTTDNNASDNNGTNLLSAEVQQIKTKLDENSECTIVCLEPMEEITKKDENKDECIEINTDDILKKVVENDSSTTCDTKNIAEENIGSDIDVSSNQKDDNENSSIRSNDKSQEQSSVCDETQSNQDNAINVAELQNDKSSDLIFENKSNDDNVTQVESKN